MSGQVVEGGKGRGNTRKTLKGGIHPCVRVSKWGEVLLHMPHCIVVNCCLPRHKAIQKTTNYLKWLVKLFPEAVEPKRLSFIKWEKDCRKLEDRGLLLELVEKVVGDFLETFCVLFILLLFFFLVLVLFFI